MSTLAPLPVMLDAFPNLRASFSQMLYSVFTVGNWPQQLDHCG
jgi:hypothetical protein